MFEIAKLKRQSKMQFTTAAAADDKGDKGDGAASGGNSQKKKTTVTFLQTHMKSMIDSLVRLKNEKVFREERMSSHCCRVSANVCMLIVLLIWLQISHATHAEYWLSRRFTRKLDNGFSEVRDADSFRSYFKDALTDVFYPDQGLNTTYIIPNEQNDDLPSAFAKLRYDDFHTDDADA